MDTPEYMSVKGGRWIQLTDDSGGFYEVNHYDGLILPRYFPLLSEPKDKLRAVKEFRYKEGDVLICAYPKSGNHWFLNMVNHMLSTRSVGETKFVNVDLMEAYPVRKLDVLPSPRVLISHMPLSHLPRDHFKNSGKVILVLRNPKDLAVSFWYHLTKDRFMGCTLSWDGFLKHFMEGNILYGSYFEYLRKWHTFIQSEKYPNIMCVYYEDLIEKPLEELKNVRRFLGVDISDDVLKAIIYKCSLTNMKADVDSGRLRTRLIDENKKPFIFRKGEIGDWQNYFTVLQNSAFNKLIDFELKDSMFQFRYQNSSTISPKPRL